MNYPHRRIFSGEVIELFGTSVTRAVVDKDDLERQPNGQQRIADQCRQDFFPSEKVPVDLSIQGISSVMFDVYVTPEISGMS